MMKVRRIVAIAKLQLNSGGFARQSLRLEVTQFRGFFARYSTSLIDVDTFRNRF
jgi:hypothetical protein